MENKFKKNLTLKDLSFSGDDWVSRHLQKFRELYPTLLLSDIRGYLLYRCKHLKPSSRRTLAFGFKRAVKESLGYEYIANAELRFLVDGFFAEFTRSVQYRPRPKPVPSKSDIARLIQASGPKTGLIVHLLYVTGLRVSEACSIRLSNIYPMPDGLCQIRVRRKGGEDGTLICPSDLIERIQSVFKGKVYLLETARGNPYNRQGIYTLVTEASKRHLGYSVNPHLFRHAFASHMVECRPGKIAAIMRQGGWRSAEVFMGTYVHDSLTKDDLPEIQMTG